MLGRHSLAKACPCVGGRCLSASFSKTRDLGGAVMRYRNLSTETGAQSIFSSEVSAWDNVFEDITSSPSSLAVPTDPLHRKPQASRRPMGDRRPRAVAMTQQESQAFGGMFQAIFEQSQAASAQAIAGVGQQKSSVAVMYNRLRSRIRVLPDTEADLDRKKEEMDMCETDVQLLEWAMREVFGESQQYEEAARRAAAEEASLSPSSSSQPSSKNSAKPAEPLRLQPASYPHLLAELMRKFRDKFKDPHLALATFEHARTLSIASFVFGCTTPAFNELIETRWRCFRDLRGVCDGLEEMRVNGVPLDHRTRALAERVRREVGERTLWQEESELGAASGEVWEMVARIERLTVSEPKRITLRRLARGAGSAGGGGKKTRGEGRGDRDKRSWSRNEEEWKKNALDGDAADGWSFDKWVPKKPSMAQGHTKKRIFV